MECRVFTGGGARHHKIWSCQDEGERPHAGLSKSLPQASERSLFDP